MKKGGQDRTYHFRPKAAVSVHTLEDGTQLLAQLSGRARGDVGRRGLRVDGRRSWRPVASSLSPRGRTGGRLRLCRRPLPLVLDTRRRRRHRHRRRLWRGRALVLCQTRLQIARSRRVSFSLSLPFEKRERERESRSMNCEQEAFRRPSVGSKAKNRQRKAGLGPRPRRAVCAQRSRSPSRRTSSCRPHETPPPSQRRCSSTRPLSRRARRRARWWTERAPSSAPSWAAAAAAPSRACSRRRHRPFTNECPQL